MSRSAKIQLPFGGAVRTFKLGIGEWQELERLCGDVGPGVILTRLSGMAFKVADVREVLRVGMIGGGLADLDALALVTRYVDQLPIGEHVKTALAVATAGFVGAPEDPPVGESLGEAAATEATPSPLPSPTVGSTSRRSTGSGRRSGSRRATSTE